MSGIELDAMQMDAIREINSIAVGCASTSLSRLLCKDVSVGQPAVFLESARGASEILEGREHVMTAVHCLVEGEVPGSILLFLSTAATAQVVRMLTGKLVSSGTLEEMDIAAIKELANILVGAYLGGFSRELGATLVHSVSDFVLDMGGAILDGPLTRQSLSLGYAVLMEGSLAVEHPSCSMRLLFVLDPRGLPVMLEALRLWKE